MLSAAELDVLVRQAQQGGRDAFRDLVLATQRDLAIAVATHARSREQVEEVLQETYVTCFEKLSQYRLEGTFRPWLKAIARNHLIGQWREQRRFAELQGDEIEALVAADGLDGIDRDDGAGEREVARLAACLERLPARARTLLERRYADDLPLARLAQQFKRSAATLSVTLHRLRQQLRRCVEQAP
jgi:RNA polymerase sigma-70 factor (ECF subfamily)